MSSHLHHLVGDNIITRGLSKGMHNSFAIRGFHAIRVFASKGFYPIWKLFGRGRLEGKIELRGDKSFDLCGVYSLEGIKSFPVEKTYCMIGTKSFGKIDALVLTMTGDKTINVKEETINIEGTKLMQLSESINLKGKKDLSPILTALDII